MWPTRYSKKVKVGRNVQGECTLSGVWSSAGCQNVWEAWKQNCFVPKTMHFENESEHEEWIWRWGDASLLMCKAARRIVLMTTLPSSLHRPASLLRRTMNLKIQGNQGMFDDSVWFLIVYDQGWEPVSLKPGHCSWSTGEKTQNETVGNKLM